MTLSKANVFSDHSVASTVAEALALNIPWPAILNILKTLGLSALQQIIQIFAGSGGGTGTPTVPTGSTEVLTEMVSSPETPAHPVLAQLLQTVLQLISQFGSSPALLQLLQQLLGQLASQPPAK